MSVTRHWSWNDKTKILTVYCRESGAALWQHAFKQFQNASDCAAIFMALYDQGVRHGKQIALEEMCCTEDQVEVVRVPVSCPRCGMSQTARKWFVRRAKAYGLDTSTGVFGEWSDKETRKCWYFWIMSWQLRARDINKRSKKRASVTEGEHP